MTTTIAFQENYFLQQNISINKLVEELVSYVQIILEYSFLKEEKNNNKKTCVIGEFYLENTNVKLKLGIISHMGFNIICFWF